MSNVIVSYCKQSVHSFLFIYFSFSCSIVCCNIHKENGCTKPVFNISEERKKGSSSETYSHITDDTIPLNKLQRLGM